MIAVARCLIALVLLICAGFGLAHAYPDRPVRLVVPYPPGGGTDVIGRLLAQRLGDRLGQQVIVENRGGAGGVIGTDIVAKAAPDGYTLLLVPTSHVINPSVYAKLPYDTRRDFAPVSLIASASIMLAVNPSVQARNVAELILVARSGGSVANFGSAGIGTVFHLVGELFKKLASLDVVHVPYRGGAPVVNALLANEIPMAFETVLALRPHVDSGRLRGLVVTQATRSTAAPNVPSAVEAGFPDLIADNSYALFAPAGTPTAIVEVLSREVRTILADPETARQLSEQGAEVVASTPAELGLYVDRELTKWAAVVRDAGIRPE